MTAKSEYLLMKALNFKYMGADSSGAILDFMDKTGQLDEIKAMPIKNVCAKLAVTLVDQIDEACNVLSMSKREFIEIAITNLIAEFDDIAEKHDIYAPHIPPADFGKGDES